MKRSSFPMLALAATVALAATCGSAMAAKGFPGPRGGTLRGPAPQLRAQTVNRNFPKANPNMLEGDVDNELLGNGTGAGPDLGDAPVAGSPAPGRQGPIGGAPQSGAIAVKSGGAIGAKVAATPIRAKADCRHVIDMLVRHCIAQRRIDPCVRHLFPERSPFGFGWGPGPLPMGPIVFGDPVPGDLELLEVGMLSDATPEQGPLYQVTIRNHSRFDAEHFRVSIVAVLGAIAVDSPSVTVNVDSIPAGETATLQIQLPVTVMALGPEGAEPAPFETIVVAIDSFDELMERNEVNNIATLKRAEVKLIEVGAAVATEEVSAAPAAPQEGAPAPQAPAPESAPAPETEELDPTEEISIDDLTVGEADEAKKLFVRQ